VRRREGAGGVRLCGVEFHRGGNRISPQRYSARTRGRRTEGQLDHGCASVVTGDIQDGSRLGLSAHQGKPDRAKSRRVGE
jgi:hypothetical protein